MIEVRRVVLVLLIAGCSVVTGTDEGDLSPIGARPGDDDDVIPGDDDDDVVPDGGPKEDADPPVDGEPPTDDVDVPPEPVSGTPGVLCDSDACEVGQHCCYELFVPSYCHDPTFIRCTCLEGQCFPMECDDSGDCQDGKVCCAVSNGDRVEGLSCQPNCGSMGHGDGVEACSGPEGAACAFGGHCAKAEWLPEGIGACQ